jgi:hypothetical protein
LFTNQFFLVIKKMKISKIAILVALILFVASNLETTTISSTGGWSQYALAQSADLQFTSDAVFVSVEQGGSNTAIIQVHNYGGEAGSANITFAGTEPDGITVVLSTTSINNLSAGTYENVTATITATADLWPLGPRRLDLSLNNGTFEFDSTYLEMNVIAPVATTTATGIFGMSYEFLILSTVATALVIGLILFVRRRR